MPYSVPYSALNRAYLGIRGRGQKRRPFLGSRTQPNRTVIAIAQIWYSLLHRADIGIDENFFDAGGDSLLILALHKELRERLAVTINVTDLFRDTTIRKQAKSIDRVLG